MYNISIKQIYSFLITLFIMFSYINIYAQKIIKEEYVPSYFTYGKYRSLNINYVFYDSLKVEKLTYYVGKDSLILLSLHTYRFLNDSLIEHGLHFDYDTNGIIISKVMYLDGKLNGYSYAYYDSGKYSNITKYSKGYTNGISTDYYRSGNVMCKGKYKGGLKVGKWKYYYDNGKLQAKGKFSNKIGQDTMMFNFFNDTCGISYFTPISSGFKIISSETQIRKGIWTFYNCNGILIRKYKFSDGAYTIIFFQFSST